MLDYLIIGQGIAGTVLAETFLNHQKTVLVVNDEAGFSSSKVAAGIFNPLTGKKLHKTWLADSLFPFLEKFYTDLEKKLNTNFFHKKAIYRPFRGIDEQNEWLLRASLPEFEHYLEKNNDNNQNDNNSKNDIYENYIKNPFGGIATKQAGYVDLPTLLHAYKAFLIEKNAYLNTNFLYEDVVFEEDKVVWKEFSAKKIIFCEGVNAIQNPFLKHLPFSPVKGEILEIKFLQDKNQNFNNIVNLGVSLVPIERNNQQEKIIRVASTYSWQSLDWEISAKATQELTEKATQILSVPFEVVGQVAGVRPATKNRRPIVGLHHTNTLIGVFNGLGSKGVSLAPYLAHCFYEFLEKNIPLPNEMNGV